ncbi:transcription factor bHLH68-like [Magnolia sinica]|uniref:transcription factor bHLH68-like n=1 Tax=Magnolia sinica TaxID=86752 RepID=UPI00265987FF|nr:transcription factor bHLH68-like [Magnolia sinica]
MNRGVLQSSPVQQMMGGNLNWWSINNMRAPPQQPSPLLPPLCPQYTPPASSLPLGSWHETQDLPESWSQLLMSGLVGEEERLSFNHPQAKKVENWEDQVLFPSSSLPMIDVKQESSESGYAYGHGNEELHAVKSPWGSQILPPSPPRSCVTTNMLDFSNTKVELKHQQPDNSSECNSTANGAVFKKARIQPPAQPAFKVRKEKLGDRITALHQLVSPFGKTDTASVLLEAIGYIRFLQSQIEALSSPYLATGSANMRQPVQGERNCIFPEDPGQLLNDASMKRRGALEKDGQDELKKDLRSRGLCLVPVSCTLQVGSDNGADYWAPTLGGGFR